MNKGSKLVSTLGIVICFLGLFIFIKWNPYYIWKIKFMVRGWWTLLIIIPSVISILKRGPRIFNVVPCLLGILLFLSCRYIINFYWIRRYIIPVAVVLLGIIIFIGSKNKKNGI